MARQGLPPIELHEVEPGFEAPGVAESAWKPPPWCYGAVAAVALVVVGIVVISTMGPEPVEPSQRGVIRSPPAPISPDGEAAVVWTGDEVAVWEGGTESGAAFSPQGRRWRLLAPSPLTRGSEPPVAAMTTTGMLVVSDGAMAYWHPATNTWSEATPALAHVSDLVVVGDVGISASANARVDLATGEWSSLPDRPIDLAGFTSVSAGSSLFLVGFEGGATRPVAIAYEVDHDRWRTFAPLPEDLASPALAVAWDGHRVVVVSPLMKAAAYDPGRDTWQSLPPIPMDSAGVLPIVESVNGFTAAFLADAVAVLTPGDHWVPVPYDTFALSTVPAGAELLVVGVDRDAPATVVDALDPQVLASTPDRIRVGSGDVRLGGDTTVSIAEQRIVGDATRVRVIVDRGDHRCELTSTGPSSQASAGPFIQLPGREVVNGVAWTYGDRPTGFVRQTFTANGSMFTISCDNADFGAALQHSAEFGHSAEFRRPS